LPSKSKHITSAAAFIK